MVYIYAVMLSVLNLGFWAGIRGNFLGTWLMVLVTAVLKWWQPGYVLVSWTVLGVAAGLALLGEVLEFALGAAGARHSGGIHTCHRLGDPWQPHRRDCGDGTAGVAGGYPARGLPRCVRRFTYRGSVGGAPAVPELRSRLGGRRGPVLGDYLQADYRRPHRGRPGAGCVLLMHLNRGLWDRTCPSA
jgi:hypothetical protein